MASEEEHYLTIDRDDVDSTSDVSSAELDAETFQYHTGCDKSSSGLGPPSWTSDLVVKHTH
jgi:hypothetical protein